MATTITSLTNLSRFLENCKNIFARKPAYINCQGDYVKIPVSRFGSGVVYELSFVSTNNVTAIIQLFQYDTEVKAKLITGTIYDAPYNITLKKLNSSNVVYAYWGDIGFNMTIKASDGSAVKPEVVQSIDTPNTTIDIDTSSSVFYATYNVTTASEVAKAISDQKIIIVRKSDVPIEALYEKSNSTYYYFYCPVETYHYRITLKKSDSTWSMAVIYMQYTGDRVNTISSSSTTSQYPSAKGVYDFINRSETSITNADPFYTRRCTSVGFKGNGMITNIKGNSTIWNQVFEITSGNTSASSNGITYSRSGNVITLSGTASAAVTFSNIFEHNFEKKDHKYIVRNNTPSGVSLNTNIYSGTSINNTNSIQTGVAHSNPQKITVTVTSGTNLGTGTKIIVNVFDLTEMFGAGNEPSTVEAFNAIVPSGLYEYNPGSILNFNPEALQTTGFNQWDEVWEYGYIDLTTGVKTTYNGTDTQTGSNHRIVSKNFIPVLPSTTYYIYFGMVAGTGDAIYVVEYDATKNFIQGYNNQQQNTTFTTSANTHYILFENYKHNISYQHDICINFSNSSLNGTYKPYVDSKLSLKLSSATSTVNGVSTVVAPYGLQSAGDIYDELMCDPDGYARKLIKRVGSVDLGSLTWTYYAQYEGFYTYDITDAKRVSSLSAMNQMNGKGYVTIYNLSPSVTDDEVISINAVYHNQNSLWIKDTSFGTDAAAFKTAMSGVYLNYELNNPIVYQLDNPIPILYMMDYLGVERVLPEWGSEPKTSKMIADVNYYETTLDAKQVYGAGASSSDAESTSNKVNEIDSSSTDIQYPSAKAVYDAIFAAMDASY